jgi:hypothetical protein
LYDLTEFSAKNSEYIMDMKPKTDQKLQLYFRTSYQKLNSRTDKKLTIGATATFGNTGNMTTDYTNSTYRYADAQQDQKDITIIEQKLKI